MAARVRPPGLQAGQEAARAWWRVRCASSLGGVSNCRTHPRPADSTTAPTIAVPASPTSAPIPVSTTPVLSSRRLTSNPPMNF
ncbi:hypothetical protein ACFQ0T_22675 [Kitasatospora gansuensis]